MVRIDRVSMSLTVTNPPKLQPKLRPSDLYQYEDKMKKFSQFCKVYGLGGVLAQDRTSANAKCGKILEGKIMDYLGGIFYDDDIKSQVSMETDMWRGIADGVGTDTIYEIKTSTHSDEWETITLNPNNPPMKAILQAGAYAELLQKERLVIVIGFPTEEELINPALFQPSQNNVFFKVIPYRGKIKQLVQAYMKRAEDFFRKYISSGRISLEEIAEEERPYFDQITADYYIYKSPDEKFRRLEEIDKIRQEAEDKIKALYPDEARLRESIKQDGLAIYTGTVYDYTVTQCQRQSLNQELIRTKYPEIFSECQTTTKFNKIIKRRKDDKK